MPSDSSPFDDIDRLFSRMTEQFEALDPADFGVPNTPLPVDVFDEGDAFLVLADLPGYDADDINVSMPSGRTVRIDAARETRTDSVALREERRQSISRSISVPEAVLEEETTATYDDGVLEIRLPKRDASEDDSGVSVPVE